MVDLCQKKRLWQTMTVNTCGPLRWSCSSLVPRCVNVGHSRDLIIKPRSSIIKLINTPQKVWYITLVPRVRKHTSKYGVFKHVGGSRSVDCNCYSSRNVHLTSNWEQNVQRTWRHGCCQVTTIESWLVTVSGRDVSLFPPHPILIDFPKKTISV
jgi:hypothetical protein